MLVPMAGQTAGIRLALVSDGIRTAGSNHLEIEVHHPLARQCPDRRRHAVRGMTDGTGESVIDVPRVLAKAGVAHNNAQIMALCTKRIITACTQVRWHIQICN